MKHYSQEIEAEVNRILNREAKLSIDTASISHIITVAYELGYTDCTKKFLRENKR